jgi:FMN phosphatase YigB (HAD superfamily)
MGASKPARRGADPWALPARRRVLLCDAGNTLVFLDCRAVAAVLQARGVSVAPERLRGALRAASLDYQRALTGERATHEDGWRIYIAGLLRCAGVEGELDPLVDCLREEHDRFNLWRSVPDGLRSALVRLTEADPPTRLGIVSNSEGRLLQLLERLGLADLFEVVLDSGVEGVAKPGREIFERALERLGEEPGDALYLGDLPQIDIDGARRAGLGAVLVDRDGLHEDYSAAPRVTSVAQLVAHWLG